MLTFASTADIRMTGMLDAYSSLIGYRPRAPLAVPWARGSSILADSIYETNRKIAMVPMSATTGLGFCINIRS